MWGGGGKVGGGGEGGYLVEVSRPLRPEGAGIAQWLERRTRD